MEIINPSELHFKIKYSYVEKLKEFTNNVLKLLSLEEGETLNSEHMSIQCLRKDVFEENNEYSVLFFWNHYQKSEKHFIELYKEKGAGAYVKMDSTVYKFTNTTEKLIQTKPDELYSMFLSLYYANAWFSQLVDN